MLFSNETYYSWNQLWQIIEYTKSYSLGLEIIIILLKRFEEFRLKFNKREQNTQLISLYGKFLIMLDYLDMWEDYLKNWELIKQKSLELKIGNEYSEASREFHFKNGAQEFFLENTEIGFRLSFLYGTHSRKELIEKKILKAKFSKKIANLTHEQQDVLSKEEIKERYDWLIKYFRTGEYDYNPPASKQKEKKTKENRTTIKIKEKDN